MKKSLLKIFAALFSCATLALGFTACENEHEHDYTVAVIAPTCTEQGYTIHTCDCGETYIDTYVNALSHTYDQEIANDKYLESPATCTSNFGILLALS